MKKRPSLHPEPSSFLNSERVVFVDPKNHQRDIASWLLTRRWCYVEWERLLNEKMQEQREMYEIFTPFRDNDIFHHLPQKYRVEDEIESSEVHVINNVQIFVADQAFEDLQALESHIQKTIRLYEQLRTIYSDWDKIFSDVCYNFHDHIYNLNFLNTPNFDLQNAQAIMESDDLPCLQNIWRYYKDRIMYRLFNGRDRETWLVEYVLQIPENQDLSKLEEQLRYKSQAETEEHEKNRFTLRFPKFPKMIPTNKK